MRDKGLIREDRIHFKATFRDKAVGYALSQEAIEMVPADILAMNIAGCMVPQLVKLLKG
jgi:hypothetical protein